MKDKQLRIKVVELETRFDELDRDFDKNIGGLIERLRRAEAEINVHKKILHVMLGGKGNAIQKDHKGKK